MVLGSAHLVSFKVELSLVVWSLVLVLAGRALNIFPLATLCNKFRCVLKKMIWLFYQKAVQLASRSNPFFSKCW